MNRRGLIYLFTIATEGLPGLQRKIFEVRKILKVLNASSAYKRYSRQSGMQQVESVIEVEIREDQGLLELSTHLQAFGATLLMIEGELRVDPTLPLPHPMVLLDPFVLKMAAECAPYWEHRVKQETLQSLSNQNSTHDLVEFLTQGSALITL